MNRVTSLA